MDATQVISDSILESDEEENEEPTANKKGQPVAKLCILKNEHIPVAELPLFLGDNVIGRDPSTCTLPMPAPSVSKQHATICICVHGRRGCYSNVDMEALVWDLGSMNGTRKGRLKLTPNVRYALSNGDSLVVADIPCQYVSCAKDAVSSQGDMKTPKSRRSGVKASLPDASGDSSTGGKNCVNGGKEASDLVSRLDRDDIRKTPAQISCLSFEKTPNQPQGTLVPQSDSDSEEERCGRDGGRKALVSDSDSHKSSPACSTFLSPTNKVVPESEDESPITPSCSNKGRSYIQVSVTAEKPSIDAGQQQQKGRKALAIVDSSEEEEGRQEEKATSGGATLKESGEDMPVKQKSTVSSAGEDEPSASTAAGATDVIPAFNLDSDTDAESEEEDGASVGPVTLNPNQQADPPPNTVRFHMDSGTGVDEDALDKGPISVPPSDDSTKRPHAAPLIQPQGITVDSDTDVDDDDDADASAAADKAKPVAAFLNADAADAATSTQPKDFHLDSDTDVDEAEELGAHDTLSKTEEVPARFVLRPNGVSQSSSAAPRSLHLDSDTDDEVIPAPALSELPAAGADNSDTDVEEEDSAPVATTTLSTTPGIMLAAARPDSDPDTDVDECSVPPAADKHSSAESRQDSDTDVEDKETGVGEIPMLCREKSSLPPMQDWSTPVHLPEGEVEQMETQAFLSPSLGPFRRASTTAGRPAASSSFSDSLEEEDFVVAETQSFVLQNQDRQSRLVEDVAVDPTQDFCLEAVGDDKDGPSSRGESFQLGLSESSHLQDQVQALAMESTQAFVDGSVKKANTQAHVAFPSADGTSLGNGSSMGATQAYEGDEHPARGDVLTEKDGQVDMALQETQAFIAETYSDSKGETKEGERKNITTAETLCFLSMAETQPVSPCGEEDSSPTESPDSSLRHIEDRKPNEREVRDQHGQERPLIHPLSIAETQPMYTSEDEDSIQGPPKRNGKETQPTACADYSAAETQLMDVGVEETQPVATSTTEESGGEDSISSLQERNAKPLQSDETQSLTTSAEASARNVIDETQPMVTCEVWESKDEDSIPGPRRRKAEQPQLEGDKSQMLVNPEILTAERQPMETCKGDEDDGEDLVPGPRKKRKSKPLQFEEESQSLTGSHVSTVKTQDMVTGEDDESDDEQSILARRKRKALPLRLEEDESQTLGNSEVSTAEPQPVGTCKDDEDSDEDLIPGPRKKRKSKPLQIEESQSLPCADVSSVKTQDVVAGEDESGEEQSILGQRKRKAKPLQLREEETRSSTNPGTFSVESQPARAETGQQTRRGKGRQSEAGTSGVSIRSKRGAKLRGEEEHSESFKRQTSGNKGFPTTRGRRGKSRPVESDSEEEEEAEPVKQTREKKSTSQQKHVEEEAERNKQTENINLVTESEEALEEQEDVTVVRPEERGNMERERRTNEEERLDVEKQEQWEMEGPQERKDQESVGRDRKTKGDQERLQDEKEKLRAESERTEREQREQVERDIKVKNENNRLEQEKVEREERARLEREEKAKKEAEEQERLERARKEQEDQARLEREREERERVDQEKREKEARERKREEVENREDVNHLQMPARGRRSTRRTSADSGAAEVKQPSIIAAHDDVPARRTRSRSNSSNSVSSEQSATSVTTQESRGRGRGARRPSGQGTIPRGGSRRRRVAADLSDQRETTHYSNEISSPGSLSQSNSENLSSSVSSQSRGRGGRQRGRGRKTEPVPDSIPPLSSPSGQNSAPKPTFRGRRGRMSEVSSNEGIHGNYVAATRGRRRANVEHPEPAATEQSNQEDACASEDSPLPKRNTRGQTTAKREAVEESAAPAGSGGDDARDKWKGRKKELEADAGSSRATEVTVGAAPVEDPVPVQTKRGARASAARGTKNAKEATTDVEVKEEAKEEIVDRRARVQPSVGQRRKKEKQEESRTSVTSEASEPQTPISSASRKREAPVRSSPVAKIPRSSSASPAASGRRRTASQTFKVLFTGLVDEAGERVLARLGGSMAKGVADMNCLVTDKVRRTVKFLCAVAKGIPIVTTQWLEKSGKAGSFLPPDAFIVNDPEQEKKFSFCLEESLRVASTQPLLQGYEIHITKSVKPEPVHMKDIISCSGATFLPRMPSSHKPQTVVISCEEDLPLCVPAAAASLPVVSAEFILSGILQQKLDLQTYKLAAPTSSPPPAGGRGRGRKRT